MQFCALSFYIGFFWMVSWLFFIESSFLKKKVVFIGHIKRAVYRRFCSLWIKVSKPWWRYYKRIYLLRRFAKHQKSKRWRKRKFFRVKYKIWLKTYIFLLKNLFGLSDKKYTISSFRSRYKFFIANKRWSLNVRRFLYGQKGSGNFRYYLRRRLYRQKRRLLWIRFFRSKHVIVKRSLKRFFF